MCRYVSIFMNFVNHNPGKCCCFLFYQVPVMERNNARYHEKMPRVPKASKIKRYFKIVIVTTRFFIKVTFDRSQKCWLKSCLGLFAKFYRLAVLKSGAYQKLNRPGKWKERREKKSIPIKRTSNTEIPYSLYTRVARHWQNSIPYR